MIALATPRATQRSGSFWHRLGVDICLHGLSRGRRLRRSWDYRIAGLWLHSDESIRALSRFGGDKPSAVSRLTLVGPPFSSSQLCEETFSGEAWVAGSVRFTRCALQHGRYHLSVSEGGGEWLVAADGTCIEFVGDAPQDPGVLEETLLGPVLALALAAQKVFLLHASAVRTPEGNLVALVGPSGVGKSTLARLLGGIDSSGIWELVADDALAVRGTPSGLEALPQFPQLKLPWGDQPGSRLEGSLPLAAVFHLRTVSSEETGLVPSTRAMAAAEAVRVLLSHTIGSRLFSRSLLDRHLNVMATAATRVPVYSLAYRQRLSVGTLVGGRIRSLVDLENREATRCHRKSS